MGISVVDPAAPASSVELASALLESDDFTLGPLSSKSLSPDGRVLVLELKRQSTSNRELVLVDLDSRQETQVAVSPVAAYPLWNARSDRLALIAALDDPTTDGLYLASSATQFATLTQLNAAPAAGAQIELVAFRP